MWVFDTVGLTTFMAVVGLSAGPALSQASEIRAQPGHCGPYVAVLPHITSILVGRYILKMNP